MSDDPLNEATQASVGPVVSAALAEDVGAGDLTAALIEDCAVVGAQIIARESMVVCGEAWVDEVFRQLDDSIIVDWYIGDGGTAEAGDIICKLGLSFSIPANPSRDCVSRRSTRSAAAVATIIALACMTRS